MSTQTDIRESERPAGFAPPTGYAASHGQTPAMGSATWAPKCPECGRKMHYEDDRDADGNLTQSPWWECSDCLVSIGMMQTTSPRESAEARQVAPGKKDCGSHPQQQSGPDKRVLAESDGLMSSTPHTAELRHSAGSAASQTQKPNNEH